MTASVIARLLNRYFTLAGEVIRSKNGVIDKYIGDSIMAFWTPPFSQGDAHAADACLSALGQRQAVEKVRSELPEILGLRRDLPEFRVRMGLDTGEAVLGTIGSPKAMSYTVIGDTVNLASRLEGVNKVYGTDIIVSETTFRLAQAVVEARELDVVNVVGKQEPQRIYELVAHAGQISDWQGRLHEAYAEALSAYRQQDWAVAEHHLDMALKSAPEDGPSLVLRERVRKLRTSPPRTEWDGVWHLVSK